MHTTRQTGSKLYRWLSAVMVFVCASSFAASIELQCSTNQAGQYEKLEFQVRLGGQHTNPFDPDEADLSVQFTAAGGGKQITIPAFYVQDYERRQLAQTGPRRDWFYPSGIPSWKARFAPAETGIYQAVAILRDREGTRSSSPVTFDCRPSSHKGFVRVSRKDPRFFELSTGEPFFPIGQNLAFIGSGQYVTLSKAENIFAKLSANGANFLRIWTCCEDWALAIEARKSAWGRSWDRRPSLETQPDAEGKAIKCLKIDGGNSNLDVNPSHPIALRPGTRYAVTGQIRTAGDAALRLEVHGSKSRVPMASPANGAWERFHQEFQTSDSDFWLGPMKFYLEGTGAAWVHEVSLKEAGGGPELLWEAGLNRPARGFYNPLDGYLLDELVQAAETNGIYLQLCLLTRDLYMDALKDPASAEYRRAVADAKKFMRYAVARWGYSTQVAAWEYWNEMNPGLPTDAFYTALGEYLEAIDVNHHLRTTSTWGPSPKDCRHAKLDIADTHFYLRPTDKARLRDEVDAILERTRWLREQAPGKPAHLGEFGLANEKWQLTPEMKNSRDLTDVHNALWASALSGASGTAQYWWWERLDEGNVYPLYRPLSRFIADIPWTGGDVATASATASDKSLRAMGVKTQQRAWLWLFNSASSWSNLVIEKRPPTEVQGAQVELKDLPVGTYRVQWFDTRSGQMTKEESVSISGPSVRLLAPSFARDAACKIEPR